MLFLIYYIVNAFNNRMIIRISIMQMRIFTFCNKILIYFFYNIFHLYNLSLCKNIRIRKFFLSSYVTCIYINLDNRLSKIAYVKWILLFWLIRIIDVLPYLLVEIAKSRNTMHPFYMKEKQGARIHSYSGRVKFFTIFHLAFWSKTKAWKGE